MKEECDRSPIDIYQYLEYRSFLRDRILELQKKNKKYSQRWLAKKAGLKSPQLISMIVNGHRSLTENMAHMISYALDLTEKQEDYFLLLVDLAHTENKDSQLAILDRINAHFKNGLFQNLSFERLELLRSWYNLALRELVAVQKFKPSPSWIAGALGIEEAQASEALALLIEKGFVKNRIELSIIFKQCDHLKNNRHRHQSSVDFYVCWNLFVDYGSFT